MDNEFYNEISKLRNKEVTQTKENKETNYSNLLIENAINIKSI